MRTPRTRIPISQQATFQPSAPPLPGRPAELLPLAAQVVAVGVQIALAAVAVLLGGIGLALTHGGWRIFFICWTFLTGLFFLNSGYQMLTLFPKLRALQRAWDASKGKDE